MDAMVAGRMGALVRGYYAAQCLYVAARLNIADLLSAGDKSIDELAQAAGAQPEALYRVLRALAGAGVFAELPGRRFALTELGATLRSDVAGSMRPWVLIAGDAQYKVWGLLKEVVRGGGTGFERVFRQPLFAFLGEHEELYALFNEAMESNAYWMREAVVRHCAVKAGEVVVDVGGGTGGLIRAMLEAVPGARGILLETARVIEQARAGGAGGDRLELVSGDFMEGVPAGDVMILASVLHMLPDAEALRVLGHCRAGLSARGRVLVIEQVVPGLEGGGDAAACWSDLNMLVMTGGRERTFEEYAELLRVAGFGRVEMIDEPVGAGGVYRIVAGWSG